MDKKNRFNTMLWILLLTMLLTPFVCGWFAGTRGEPLFGVHPIHFEWKMLSLNNLRTHQFQDQMETMAKQKVGLCNNAVRAYNELNYRVFHYSSAPKLVLGRDDCFYENIYIDEYTGKDFIGNDSIESNVLRFKALQQKLKKEYGKDIVLVLEPGKVRYEPEHLTRGYVKAKQTNYERFVYYLQKHNVQYLDLNRHFRQLKTSTPHPLYSKHGIHWTTYGMWQAADTISHYLSEYYGYNLPSIRHLKDSISNQNKDLDFDLEPPMNLLFELPHESLCFPQMVFGDTNGCQRPRTLIIADSYAWSLWNNGILQHWFGAPEYWYYNQSVYPHIWQPDYLAVDEQRRATQFSHCDLILIMLTDANLKSFNTFTSGF